MVGEFDPDKYFGFVYEVENLNDGTKYIGMKQFRVKRTTKVKGKKRRKVSYSSSNWRNYTTSSKKINSLINEGTKFSFQILILCTSKSELVYTEANLQHRREVLTSRKPNGERAYYNGNIAGIKFIITNQDDFTAERRRKIGANRDYSKTNWQSEGYRQANKKKKEKTWWNDGETSYHLYPEDITEDLVRGRLPFDRKQYSKVCELCKKEYQSPIKKGNTCSSKCYDKVRRPRTTIGKSEECAYCKEEFSVKAPKQKYCTSSCKQKAYYWKNKNGRG